MSDNGNTATNIGPVLTESEMSFVQDMFHRAANTIVQASNLSKDFEVLKGNVELLNRDLEQAHNRNTALDQALTVVRNERDEVNRLLAEGRIEWDKARGDLMTLQHQLDSSNAQVNSLDDALQATRKDRDEAQFKVLELTDELDKARAALSKVQEALGIKPEPVVVTQHIDPKPEPVFHGEGEGFKPEATPNGGGGGSGSEQITQEAPKPAERRKVYEGDPDYSHSDWLDAAGGDYGFGNDHDPRHWYYAKD